MKGILIFLVALAAVDCVQIYFTFFNDYMYQTSISVGNTSKKLNVLLDFTSTQLWFFATNSSNATSSSPFLQLSSLPKLSISRNQSILKYTSENGLYDYDFAVRAYQAGNFSLTFDGNVTIRPSSFGVVYADNYTMPSQESVMGVGIIGLGSLLSSNLTSYLTGLLNNTSQFVLCTRPFVSQAVLVINEPYFNKSTLDKAVVTTYSKTPKNPGAFEFTITAAQIGVFYAIERPITAVISTMTNYLTVDKKTWWQIWKFFLPSHDNKTGDYQISCKQFRQMRINLSVQTNSTNRWLMLPAVDLVERNQNGYCILKVRPSQNSTWTLGGPFLRHHCVQVELANQRLTFVNNTIFNPAKQNLS